MMKSNVVIIPKSILLEPGDHLNLEYNVKIQNSSTYGKICKEEPRQLHGVKVSDRLNRQKAFEKMLSRNKALVGLSDEHRFAKKPRVIKTPIDPDLLRKKKFIGLSVIKRTKK